MTEISKRRVKILIPILICLVSVMGTTLLWINMVKLHLSIYQNFARLL